MSAKTSIEWTDATWSPWEGCTKVGPGCDHCYAEAMNKWLRKGENWGPGAPRREYSDEHWAKPLRWSAKAAANGVPLRVFPSVCDPFDNEVPAAWRERFFALMWCTPWVDWLLLTKRIGNAKSMLPADWGDGYPNVWIGATVVNQEEADRDVPKLLALPARVRFLSLEPLLGPVDLCNLPSASGIGRDLDALSNGGCDPGALIPHKVDWAIVGGESGRGARSMVLGWAKDIVRDCKAAGVPVMVKQLGAKPTNREGVIHIVTDRKGGDIAEWPAELRVREFPEVRQ